jgi:hypothetical protein
MSEVQLVLHALRVLIVKVPFEITSYQVAATQREKEIMLCSALENSLTWCASRYGLNRAEIDQLINFCRQSEYSTRQPVNKSWLSPNKQYRMRLECRFVWDRCEVTAVLCNPRGIAIGARCVASLQGIDTSILKSLENAVWSDDERFQWSRRLPHESSCSTRFSVTIADFSIVQNQIAVE